MTSVLRIRRHGDTFVIIPSPLSISVTLSPFHTLDDSGGGLDLVEEAIMVKEEAYSPPPSKERRLSST